MTVFGVIFNLPWTFIGLVTCVLSVPRKITFSKDPVAIIFYVRGFWWYRLFPGMRGVRAMVNGHVVQMSRWADEADLRHELIHVKQHMRWPLIYPILYFIEQVRRGSGPENRFEKEAYERAGNRYGNYAS